MKDLDIFIQNNGWVASIRFRDKQTGEVYAIDTYGLLQYLEEQFIADDFRNIPIARKYRKMTEQQTYDFLKGKQNA